MATAFYLAAFSCHAPSAVRSVRAALAEARGAPVVATLEAWCRGDSPIPAIHWDGMAVVSLTGTLAAAFLAALCPDHPAAVLPALAGLLARGRHAEVLRRCDALLDARSQQALELRLTRALAGLLAGPLAGPQARGSLAEYLWAFASSAHRTVAFIRTHQQPYLPVLAGALQDHISRGRRAGDSAGQQEADCQRLLAALDPQGTWGDASSPEALLRGGRYEDCRAACSRALESDPTGSRPQGRSAGPIPLRARGCAGAGDTTVMRWTAPRPYARNTHEKKQTKYCFEYGRCELLLWSGGQGGLLGGVIELRLKDSRPQKGDVPGPCRRKDPGVHGTELGGWQEGGPGETGGSDTLAEAEPCWPQKGLGFYPQISKKLWEHFKLWSEVLWAVFVSFLRPLCAEGAREPRVRTRPSGGSGGRRHGEAGCPGQGGTRLRGWKVRDGRRSD